MRFLCSSKTNFYKLNFMLFTKKAAGLYIALSWNMFLAVPLSKKKCVYRILFWNQAPISTEQYLCACYKSSWFYGSLWCSSTLVYEHIRRKALLLAIFSRYVESNEDWQCDYELYGTPPYLKKKKLVEFGKVCWRKRYMTNGLGVSILKHGVLKKTAIGKTKNVWAN